MLAHLTELSVSECMNVTPASTAAFLFGAARLRRVCIGRGCGIDASAMRNCQRRAADLGKDIECVYLTD